MKTGHIPYSKLGTPVWFLPGKDKNIGQLLQVTGHNPNQVTTNGKKMNIIGNL